RSADVGTRAGAARLGLSARRRRRITVTRRGLAAGSERFSVNRIALDAGQIEILQAAHIDGCRPGAVWIGAESERRTAAALAELMLDDVLVERVGAQARLAALQCELLRRHERQQIALATAMRAVALDH